MRRGEFVIAVLPGAYGKPRPALVVQADEYAGLPSVLVCPVTTELRPAGLLRIAVSPTLENGLERQSQIMVDKLSVIPVSRIGGSIGTADDALLAVVGISLTRLLGLA